MWHRTADQAADYGAAGCLPCEKVITRTKEEAADEVEQFRQQILAHEKSEWESVFSHLAKEESHCSSYQREGDLGEFPRGKMQPPFEAASFALKIGDVSGLVYSDSGVHIIYRVA
ncbi:hypothetical protein CYMTET_33437 [Cymbomonas tetramitiformis]|uniref:Peptidyl-prolyl cis-trans isomerase n=1 Tax=Cymbomonas tetramitiformis TaxID=36881 RepID=A0AAE0KQY9_9CHLO|nr:hypothetical protein CYMTET_33437 [Cymbomonas tetramitiformis]